MFPKLEPFLVPKSVTTFSVCLRTVVSIPTVVLVAEIATSGSAHPHLRGEEYLANADRFESLGDCYVIVEWFGCAFKRMKHLCCNNACLAALCRKARAQESSVLASSHGLDMLPARAESCAEYARFGNIQFEYTAAADRSYWLCLGDLADAWSTLPSARTFLRVCAHIHA